MVFAGFTFLYCFLPIVLIAYYVCPKQFRNGLLFLASLVFYAWGEPVYVLLMLFSTVSDYWHGRMIERCMRQEQRKKARVFLISSVVINLLVLGFFKYADWLIGIANQLTGAQIPLLQLALPLGISFYTFQTMSYTIDVYRGEAKVQKNILDFGMFVTMFPQLIAGPIVRYADIETEIANRKLNHDKINAGAMRFCIGLAKKVLLANQFGALWEKIIAVPPQQMPVAMGWLGIFTYGLQIYYDFSGYSDMAIGLGQMLGFTFPENFRYPYESRSISEFFRRWHMTLQKWFAGYVYYPMGGNRRGLPRQLFNILVVWALTGIWHGASGNFLVWGLYFAFWLIVEKLVLSVGRMSGKSSGRSCHEGVADGAGDIQVNRQKIIKITNVIKSLAAHIYTLVVVGIGWVFFTHTSLTEAFQYIGNLFHGALYSNDTIYLALQYAGILTLGAIGATKLPAFLANECKFLKKQWICALFSVILLLICTAYLVEASYNPFLYFRF